MPHVLLQYVPDIYGILRSTMRKAFVLQLIPISSDFLWFKIAFLFFSKLRILSTLQCSNRHLSSWR